MALSEFMAIETAYRALQPLDPAARSRAMRWLKDALGSQEALPEAALAAALGVEPAETGTVEPVVTEEAAAEPVEAVETSVEEPVEEEESAEVAEEIAEQPTEEPAATGRARRRAAASSARKARRSRSSKAAPVEDPAQERVYRRMPPAEDVLSAYEKVGTISGLAEHFGVPRHTVQGWARRLRRDGYVIGRGA